MTVETVKGDVTIYHKYTLSSELHNKYPDITSLIKSVITSFIAKKYYYVVLLSSKHDF